MYILHLCIKGMKMHRLITNKRFAQIRYKRNTLYKTFVYTNVVTHKPQGIGRILFNKYLKNS